MISLDKVSKSYDDGATDAVRELSLSVERGEMLILLGESGCGKTTTLKMINRLIEPSSGSIEVDGENVLAQDPIALRRRIGYVFQGIGLFPHLTVAENIAVVPRLLKWAEDDIGPRVDELLSMMGLDPASFRDRMPAALSGGQRQRIGVARALAVRPSVMLMDEPFGALDPLTRVDLQDQFRSLQEELGLTVVLVTHDMTEALLLGDRIAVMKEGVLQGEGAPGELIANPQNDYVASLMNMPKRQADEVEQIARGASS